MQFITELNCWLLDVDGLIKELESIADKAWLTFHDLSDEAERAKVLCDLTSDIALCDEKDELQRKVMLLENQIIEAKKAIAILKNECR